MTNKDKFIYIILSILSLGIYPYSIRKKGNKRISSDLSESNKIHLNIEKFVELIGGRDNIIGTEYTHTKIKIYFKEKSKIKIDAIQKLKSISGVVATSKYVTVIVGNQAKKIAEKI